MVMALAVSLKRFSAPDTSREGETAKSRELKSQKAQDYLKPKRDNGQHRGKGFKTVDLELYLCRVYRCTGLHHY